MRAFYHLVVIQVYASVEEWLEQFGLSRYANIFREKGVTRPFQLSSITEEVQQDIIIYKYCMLALGVQFMIVCVCVHSTNSSVYTCWVLILLFIQELKKWGIKTAAHRRKIIAEKDNIFQPIKREESISTPSSVEQDGGSPTLFPSLSPPNPAPSAHPHYLTRQVTRQLSQGSGHSSQHSQLSSASAAFTQSFEVVQIQVKKKLSNSSSGSGSSQK